MAYIQGIMGVITEYNKDYTHTVGAVSVGACVSAHDYIVTGSHVSCSYHHAHML